MFNHDNRPSVSTDIPPEFKSQLDESFNRKKQAEEAAIEAAEHMKQMTQTVNTIKEEVIDIEKEVSRERADRKKGDRSNRKIALWSLTFAILSFLAMIVIFIFTIKM